MTFYQNILFLQVKTDSSENDKVQANSIVGLIIYFVAGICPSGILKVDKFLNMHHKGTSSLWWKNLPQKYSLKNIAWCIVIKEQIEINNLKSPFNDWYLKFRKTKFNKNIFMERLMSVIMLILNLTCSVYRCNTSIECLNWIS